MQNYSSSEEIKTNNKKIPLDRQQNNLDIEINSSEY